MTIFDFDYAADMCLFVSYMLLFHAAILLDCFCDILITRYCMGCKMLV